MIRRTYAKRSLDVSTTSHDAPRKQRRIEPEDAPSSSPSRASGVFSDENVPDGTPPSSPNLPFSNAIVEKHKNTSESDLKISALQGPKTTAIYIGAKPDQKPGSTYFHVGPLLPSKNAQNLPSKVEPKQKSKGTKNKPLTQMRLDLGQQVHKRCQTCGMEYRPSVAEDKKLHDKFHTRNVDGIPMNKLGPQLRILEDEDGAYKEDIILPIERGTGKRWAACKKLVHAALEVVETELGGVGIREEELWDEVVEPGIGGGDEVKHDRYKTFLFVRKDKILGVCLAERIFEAHPVIPAAASKTEDNFLSTTTTTKQKETTDATITVDAKVQPATIGISRIWVSKCARGQGIADKLLRFAAKRFIYRVNVPREQVAFSQPTTSGARLARRFFERESGWLVYSG